MAKRLEEFDVLKGIGILLVVLGHCKINATLSQMIFSFHVPLFFIVSGFFYYRQNPSDLLKKTFMRLIVPWAFFVVLNIFYETARNISSAFDFQQAIVDTWESIDLMNEDSYLFYRSIWFLLVLFMVGNVYNLANYLLAKFHKENSPWIECFVLITYIVGYQLQKHCDLPFYLDTALSVILYYHLGFRLRSLLPKIGNGTLWQSPWLSVLVFAAMMCIPAFSLMPFVAIKLNEFPWWLPIYEIPIVIALYNIVKWLCSLSSCHFVRKIFVQCGKYSICFLGFHRIVLDAVYVVYGRLPTMSDAVYIIIYFIVLIPLVLWLSKVLEKHTPVLIGSKRKK